MMYGLQGVVPGSESGDAMSIFHDRRDAGRQLARALADYADMSDAMVLALPRGGVPVAFEVARELNLPLDVFVVRKLRLPGHPELAMGAITSGGARVLNKNLVEALRVPFRTIDAVARRELLELQLRERLYRADRRFPDLHGRTVILVDDGLATGSTMRAAVQAARAKGAKSIVVAVPVAAVEACADLRQIVEDIVCVATPTPFQFVGLWYDDFSETSDVEVYRLLQQARESAIAAGVMTHA